VVDDTYVICREPAGLIVLDQHAAHERILFEHLKKAAEERAPQTQQLLVPLTMEVSGPREAALQELVPELARLGFDLEPFGPHTFVLKSVPTSLRVADPRPLLLDLADDTGEGETGVAHRDRTEAVISRIACHRAVRAHDPLTREELRHLLADLDATALPTNCPHGRPTFLRFSTGDLERLFHRK